MKSIIDKIKMREYTQHGFEFENCTEEQILNCIETDLRKRIRFIFTTNHSKGNFGFNEYVLNNLECTTIN